MMNTTTKLCCTALIVWSSALVSAQEPRAQREPPSYTEALRSALQWLAGQQMHDGCWPADLVEAPGMPTGKPHRSVATTSVALLAFLGDGSTMRSGPYKERVKLGVKWLRSQQDEDSGRYGSGKHEGHLFDHTLATLAINEAYGLSSYRLLQSGAQSGVDWLLAQRSVEGVWGHGKPDSLSTAWALTAICTAREFELEMPVNAEARALQWLRGVVDDSGRVGFRGKGDPLQRMPAADTALFPPARGELLTAAVLMARYFARDPALHRDESVAVDRVLQRVPEWDRERGTIDVEYWYFASHALFQKGGAPWHKWSEAMTALALGQQHREAPLVGSWDPVGAFGSEGGRVYATAMMTLVLEADHRIARMRR